MYRKRYGFVDVHTGKIYLERCPKCQKENYIPAVATGQCAWCGYDATKKDILGDFVDD